MSPESPRTRWWASLRFRLTVSYALFFTVILLGVGFLFHETLDFTLHTNTEQVLAEEWASVRSVLRIEDEKANWYYDREDSEESFNNRRLRRIFLLTDADGRVIEASETYARIGVESAEEIRRMLATQSPNSPNPIWRVRSDGKVEYLIRSGAHYDEDRRQYFMSIGRGLDNNDRILQSFTVRYFTIVPLLILVLCVAGWMAAGRALRPLNDVAQVASSLSGENLGLRIERRGAGDELDNLIDTFNSMVERLELSFNQIRQFSADVSHELRTPLTAIRGQLEVALMTAASTEQYRDAVYDAIADVERLTTVVRALLQLSQAESGQVVLANEPLSLASLVREVLEQFEFVAESKSVRLTTALDNDVTILGDRIQLERCISNLLSNAVKYTPDRGTIQVSVGLSGQAALLIVEDTGKGIAADHVEHIFDRFYRVPDGTPDPDRGLGLGLSFVAWIVKAHNGKVSVKSQPGRGTRFEVRFPLAPRRAGEAGSRDAAAVPQRR